MKDTYVQYGAGYSAPDGWLNYDASPSVWLERFPVLGPFIKVNNERFPAAVRFGDIVTGLPVPDASTKGVFASHILEHLSYEDFRVALRNTFKILIPGGIFRLIVPDLQGRARRYLERAQSAEPEAASRFMRECCLGLERSPHTLIAKIRSTFGHSQHLWMWDEASMRAALFQAGFVDIRRCKFGDAADRAFDLVEESDRFIDQDLNIEEVAMEARRP